MTNHIYGPNGHIVDAFIEHLKGMTEAQWEAAGVAAWNAAGAVARAVAGAAAGAAAGVAAWNAAGAVAGAAAGAAARAVARGAAAEIQGADLLRERNQPFYFLPLFGFADEQAVLGGIDQ